jgi:hypothetical protein
LLKEEYAVMPEPEWGCGAILSGEVATRTQPIMYAHRSERIDEFDSGWQFTAGAQDSLDATQMKLWRLDKVAELEPSLTSYLALPFGTILTRIERSDIWNVESC